MSTSIDQQPAPTYEYREYTDRDNVAFDFAAEMERLGLRATVLEGGAEGVPEGVKSLTLVEKQEHDPSQDEPTVRLYRGIWAFNGAVIAHQVPNILKRTSDVGEVKRSSLGGYEVENEAASAAVEAFADNPSYDNMMAMVVAGHTESYDHIIDARIDRIQRNVLRNQEGSLVEHLRHEHVASPAGSPYSTGDLSPFIATATTPEFAAGFGETFMVLDVPLSRIGLSGESFSDSEQEILITGAIEPSWITAVARFEKHVDNRRNAKKVADLMPDISIDTETADDSEFNKKSKANREADSIAINRDRTESLLAMLGDDREVLVTGLLRSGVATYQDALWYCAHYYTDKFNELYPKTEKEELIFVVDEINDDGRFNEQYILSPEKIKELAYRYHKHRARQQQKTTVVS